MMELLDQFVNEKGFDKALTVQLREYYGRRQALDRMESYQLLMNHLSPSLKGHVAKILTGPWLAKVSWLKNAGEAFITSVALLLRNARRNEILGSPGGLGAAYGSEYTPFGDGPDSQIPQKEASSTDNTGYNDL